MVSVLQGETLFGVGGCGVRGRVVGRFTEEGPRTAVIFFCRLGVHQAVHGQWELALVSLD